jgi:selenocysteine lyase/cysteine desulfurase
MIEVLSDKSKVYCNNAGGSQILDSVIDYMTMYMKKYHVQLDCVNKVGDRANDLVQEAKQFVNILMNNVDGVIEYGCSTTQLVRNISIALSDDVYHEVVLCTALHYSMITPFEKKAKTLKWWIPNQKFSFGYSDLMKLITKDTSMLVIPHVSNITGVVFNIEYIVLCAKKINPKITILVDGVSYLPHDIIDVCQWDIDVYFVSFYKFLGPHISAVYMKNYDSLHNLNHHFLENPKLELGSFSNECLVGLLGIRDYMCEQFDTDKFDRNIVHNFFQEVKVRENELLSICDLYMNNMDYVERITDVDSNRFPIISMQFESYEVDNVNLYLNELGILSASGKFHCNKFLKKNVLRLSFLHYNTLDDIDRIFKEIIPFVESLKQKNIFFKVLGIFNTDPELYHIKRFQLSPLFTDKFNELVSDKHYNIPRYRRYSLFDTDTMQIVGTKFYQSKKYNHTKNGDILRKYQPINICDTSSFQNIITYFVDEVKYKTGITINRCMVHQIRVEVSTSVSPVPEGVHQDGYNYVAIVCITRNNIMGGVNKLFSLDDKLVYSTILKAGEMLFINDRELKHYVSDVICVDDNKDAFRDVLIITTVF